MPVCYEYIDILLVQKGGCRGLQPQEGCKRAALCTCEGDPQNLLCCMHVNCFYLVAKFLKFKYWCTKFICLAHFLQKQFLEIHLFLSVPSPPDLLDLAQL